MWLFVVICKWCGKIKKWIRVKVRSLIWFLIDYKIIFIADLDGMHQQQGRCCNKDRNSYWTSHRGHRSWRHLPGHQEESFPVLPREEFQELFQEGAAGEENTERHWDHRREQEQHSDCGCWEEGRTWRAGFMSVYRIDQKKSISPQSLAPKLASLLITHLLLLSFLGFSGNRRRCLCGFEDLHFPQQKFFAL